MRIAAITTGAALDYVAPGRCLGPPGQRARKEGFVGRENLQAISNQGLAADGWPRRFGGAR
jgi:hypothetical protein